MGFGSMLLFRDQEFHRENNDHSRTLFRAQFLAFRELAVIKLAVSLMQTVWSPNFTPGSMDPT